MLPRFLLSAVLLNVSAFAANLDKPDIERAGRLCAQAVRPSIILSYEMQSVQLVFGESDRSTCLKLLKAYTGQVELAASYHHVTGDTTNNVELLVLAKSLQDLRRQEAQLCANLVEPNAAADTLAFLGRSAFIGMTENDRQKANQLRNQAFLNASIGHLAAQMKLSQDGQKIIAQEKAAMQAVFNFLDTHPELKDNNDFEAPIQALIEEHTKRGEALAKRLQNEPNLLVQTLLGSYSSKLQWTFDASDKIISVKVNEQKTFGVCVVSDVTIVAQGQRAGVRTLNLKVAHQANRVGMITLIALN